MGHSRTINEQYKNSQTRPSLVVVMNDTTKFLKSVM